MVSFLYGATSLGMITEVLEDGNVCRVLWANYSNCFENVIRHVNINYTAIAQQLFTVQPMSTPSALTFFIDLANRAPNDDGGEEK
jgi:hypothetical protein